jgi:hypothetical protein
MSLEKVYETSLAQALETVRTNGGSVEGETVLIPAEPIRRVRLETSFPGLYPVERRRVSLDLTASTEIVFEGTGFVLTGGPSKMSADGSDPYVYEIELRLDGAAPEIVRMPVDERSRRLEIGWAYGLAPGPHTLRLELRNPRPGETVRAGDLIVYGERPLAPRY